MAPYIPVPLLAYQAVSPGSYRALLCLYKAAQVRRWRRMNISMRASAEEWGLSYRDVRGLLESLAWLDLLVFETKGAHGTDVTVFCPVGFVDDRERT